MTFQKKAPAAQPTAANASRMISIGTPVVPVAESLDYLDKTVKVENPLNVNPQLTEGNPDPATLRAVVEPTPEQQQTQPPAPAVNGEPDNDPEIDDKRFKGKTRKDIYDSFKNLESEKGRLANEVGDLRKTFDFLVQKQGVPQQPVQPPPADPEEEAKLLNQMLTKPKQFVEHIKQQTRQELTQEANRSQMQSVLAKHAQALQSPEFRQWESENVTPAMANAAIQDPATFDFIMRQFNTVRPSTLPPVSVPPAPPSNQRQVQVGIAQSTGAVNKPPSAANQTFRRRDIQSMILNEPEKYKQMLPEITKAYREGRVV